ncbi:MAG TPA: hypothetical protein VF458_16210 [Ktedonobacteraceae bacterium]
MATKITGANNVSDPIAARNALAAQSANANRKPPVARVPEPAIDVAAQLAQMQAMMQALMDTNAQLAQQNAELKAAKPAKAEKPAPSPENMSITVKGNLLTIVVDLSKDTGKHTANGANLIIAQQNSAVGPYHITYAGKDHWLSCCVARPEDNAKELRAAYRAAKKGQ